MTRADLHRADHELERKEAAVLALAHRLVRAADRDVQLQAPLQVVVEGAAVRGGDQDVGLLADQLLLGVAEELDDRRVRRVDDAGLIDRRQAVGHVVEHRSHAFLALL